MSDSARGNTSEDRQGADPFALFAKWYAKAETCGIEQANAMTLATVKPDGHPAARVVLLKSFDANGMLFFTNYLSHKAEDLREHPQAALVFWWEPLFRQVRIEGDVERATPEESDAYFASRPRTHQLGAWASEQSSVIPSRLTIIKRFMQSRRRFLRQPVARPDYWGGYRLRPNRFEFWQGRASRLHDRHEYILGKGGQWHVQRLAP